MIPSRTSRRDFAAIGLGAATLTAFGRSVSAAECPPGKVRLDGSGQQAGATRAKGVYRQCVGLHSAGRGDGG